MVKLKNPLLSLGALGNIGRAITFVRRRKTNIAEAYPTPTDARSTAQLSWRHMYQKAAALWHALSTAEKLEWESLARPKHMTGFAWFMSQCLRPNPGIYLPLQGGIMQGDIDMAKYRILRLPVPADSQEAASKTYVDTLITASLYTQGARAYNNAPVAIPNATWTIIPFNAETYDTDTIHHLTVNNSRLTCKTSGKYVIVGQVMWQANNVGDRSLELKMGDGTEIAQPAFHVSLNTVFGMQVVTIWHFEVDDYVYLRCYQNTGAPLNLLYGAQKYPYFMMQRIG